MASSTHDIGSVTEFPDGVPVAVRVAGRDLMVVRQGAGFYVLRDRCPHQGARLSSGRVGGTTLPCKPGEELVLGRVGEIVTCPWHGWEFDLRSGCSLAAPERARVATYSARAEGDRLLVTV